jgi:hypothetical protein
MCRLQTPHAAVGASPAKERLRAQGVSGSGRKKARLLPAGLGSFGRGCLKGPSHMLHVLTSRKCENIKFCCKMRNSCASKQFVEPIQMRIPHRSTARQRGIVAMQHSGRPIAGLTPAEKAVAQVAAAPSVRTRYQR